MTVRIPIYSFDITYDFAAYNSRYTFETAPAGDHVGHDPIHGTPIGLDCEWGATQIAGHVLAPDGWRLARNDMGDLCLFPTKGIGLNVDEAVDYARGRVDGFRWDRAERG